jgi:Tol biopolymer transport system component
MTSFFSTRARPGRRFGLMAAVGSVVLLAVVGGCSKSTEPESPRSSQGDVRAAWSPDGSTIAFTGLWRNPLGIYLVDTTGANVRLLRQGDGVHVTWSPDSRWIAFSSNDSIIAITASGDSTVNFTDGSGNMRPAWSPEGLRIAFVKKLGGLWLLNVVTKASIDLGRPSADYPSWNPLTSELVYLEPDLYSSSQGIIYRFKALDLGADTSRVLYSILTNYSIGFSKISPTGNALVFSVAGDGPYIQIHTADLLLKTSKAVTDDGGDYAAWSPEGSRIVYTRIQEGDGGLWIMYADGTGKRRLTTP